VLENLSFPDDGAVVHFAPEPFVRQFLEERFGDRYQAVDLRPDIRAGVKRVDMIEIEAFYGQGTLSGIIHSHVLEHVYMPTSSVIPKLNSRLRPNGLHVFQVPIANGYFRANYDPDMPKEERVKQFGLEDHVCVFGTKDLEPQLLSYFIGCERVDASKLLLGDELSAVGVRPGLLRTPNGHLPFSFRRLR